MQFPRNRTPALLACASLVALLGTHPLKADTWLAFGDSLTDTGNAFALTGGAIPDPTFYDNGRFSNGPVWFDHLAGGHGRLADHLLGTADPAQQDWNFAVGGATSGDSDLDPATGTPPGMLRQVDLARTLAQAGQIHIGRDTTALLWIGANDHGEWLTNPTRDASLDLAVADSVVANIDAATRAIADAGVGRVAVLNLFDFSLAPTTALLPEDVRRAGDAMVAHHNAELLRHAERSDAETEAQIVVVDIHGLFREIENDPAAWGFDTLAPCLPDGAAPDCTAPGSADRRVFWDGTHLTAAAHELVAGFVHGTLTSATDLPRLSRDATSLAAELTANGQRQSMTTSASHSGAWAEAKNHAVSVGGQTGRFSSLSAGWTGEWGSTRFGASVASSQGTTDGGNIGLDASAVTIGAFARHQSGALGLQSNVSIGQTDIRSTRNTGFAASPMARGATDATTLYIGAGADMKYGTGPVRVTLEAGLDWALTRRSALVEQDGGLLDGSAATARQEMLTSRLGIKAEREFNLAHMPATLVMSALMEKSLTARNSGGEVTLGSGQTLAASDETRSGPTMELGLGLAVDLSETVLAHGSITTRSSTPDSTAGVFGVQIRF